MTQASDQELEVMIAYQSVAGLLEKVKSNPLVYEDLLSDITDIMLKAGEVKRELANAIYADQQADNLDVTMSAKLRIGGWQ